MRQYLYVFDYKRFTRFGFLACKEGRRSPCISNPLAFPLDFLILFLKRLQQPEQKSNRRRILKKNSYRHLTEKKIGYRFITRNMIFTNRISPLLKIQISSVIIAISWCFVQSPEKNVTLCFSLFDFGLNDLIASLRFDLQKCLIKTPSTRSKSTETWGSISDLSSFPCCS